MKLVIVVILKIWFLWSIVFIKVSFSSMMSLNDLSRLDSSVRYLNLNLESHTLEFEVVWHLEWKFELKPFFIISLLSTVVKGNFMLVHVRHSHLHLSFSISVYHQVLVCSIVYLLRKSRFYKGLLGNSM